MMYEPKTCEQCGKVFLPPYKVTAAYWQRRRFCSPACNHAGTTGVRKSNYRRVMVPIEERFWQKVNKVGQSECWLWKGAVMRGYGYLAGTRGEKAAKAHRLSYMLNVGPIPEGLCVCHKCDVSLCVNPAHLFLGTRAENNADKVRKGRQASNVGTNNPRAKLNERKVRMVFRLRDKGMSQQAIGDRFGVCQVVISNILKRRIWKHVEI